LALAQKRSPEAANLIETRSYIVVTQESPNRPRGRTRIPEVCQHYDVPCMNLFGMFRNEGWRFEIPERPGQ
jgi:hypothetical protein